MPFNPQNVAAKLILTGNKQIDAAVRLKAYSESVKNVALTLRDDQTINESMDSVEAGTRSVRRLLSPIASAVHSIGSLFDAITVPTVDFTRTTFDIPVIGRQRFVTGITVGSVRPFRAIAASIENVADDLDAIREALLSIADGTNRIQGELPGLAANLLSGSSDMKEASIVLTDCGTAIKDAGNLLAIP